VAQACCLVLLRELEDLAHNLGHTNLLQLIAASYTFFLPLAS
jgi:hypothetical protein